MVRNCLVLMSLAAVGLVAVLAALLIGMHRAANLRDEAVAWQRHTEQVLDRVLRTEQRLLVERTARVAASERELRHDLAARALLGDGVLLAALTSLVLAARQIAAAREKRWAEGQRRADVQEQEFRILADNIPQLTWMTDAGAVSTGKPALCTCRTLAGQAGTASVVVTRPSVSFVIWSRSWASSTGLAW